MNNYRNRIYADYTSAFQDKQPIFDPEAAAQWGKSYNYYLGGWLPKNKDAAILDLACGGGNLLYFFKQHGYTNINGVDISPSQVQLARQVIPDITEANIFDFLEANSGSFDLIIGLDIVEHFHKDEVLRFLDGCYAALNPDGRLILQTPNADSPWGPSVLYGDFTHEVCFSSNALGRLLNLCGFSNIEAREQGPILWGYSLKSTLRYFIWQSIRTNLKIWNMAETGSVGSGIFTRTFIISGYKL